MYHQFFQDHLALDGAGISWGALSQTAATRGTISFCVLAGADLYPSMKSWTARRALGVPRLRPLDQPPPVAIWVDQWYDGNAIFTGSATLDEHDNPIITYPGMCGYPRSKTKSQPAPPCRGGAGAEVACRSGATYNHAVPSNRSDVLLKNWSMSWTSTSS
jgi:hypothetical protein